MSAKRTTMWFWITAGSATYLTITTSLGLHTVREAVSDFFACTYWVGVTLAIHWFSERPVGQSKIPEKP